MGLLAELVDDTTPEGAHARAAQIEQIRAMLEHPKDARIQPEGSAEWVWVKAPKVTPENVEVVLTRDPWFRSRVALNDFTGRLEWEGRDIRDADLTRIRIAMARTYRLRPSLALTKECVGFVSDGVRVHPVRDYLEGVRWDGKPRIDRLLCDYAGCDDTPLHGVLSRRFLISCVARIMQPGAKVDTVLILAGPQGYGKSTFFGALAGRPWFKDTAIDLRNKDAYIAIRGAWIYEMAELASMRPRDAETVKAFLSAQVDTFRPPYGQFEVSQPRQCVFVGTTNEPSFLNDPTGARRFWPAEVKRAPSILEVTRDRDQLWAEAVVAFRAGERWWLEVNESDELIEAQEQYKHEDPWLPKIERWIADRPHDPKGITAEIILNDALDMDSDKQGKHNEMRVGGILSGLGYVKRRTQVQGRRRWRWFPGE